MLDVRVVGVRPDELDLHVDEIEAALAASFLKVRVRDVSTPALTEGDLPSADTVVGAFIRELEARIAGLVAKRSGTDEDKRAARSARARARETTAAVKAIPKTPGPLPTGDLKKLFREAAKRMHPDLAPDDETRHHAEAFMKRLNQAFAARDEQAIVELREPDIAARRPGMLGDVSNALLHDAIGGELDVARQPRRQIDLLQSAADVIAPLQTPQGRIDDRR